MDSFGEAGERGRADSLNLLTHRDQLRFRSVDQSSFAGVGNSLHQDEITQALEKIERESAWIVTGVHHAIDSAEQRGPVTGRQGVYCFVDERDVGDSREERARADT